LLLAAFDMVTSGSFMLVNKLPGSSQGLAGGKIVVRA
jgi:hypothetical protein